MYPTCPFNLKPEYVDEMTIDAKTELKHKAMCVHQLLGSSYTQEDLKKYCDLYGITTADYYSFKKSKIMDILAESGHIGTRDGHIGRKNAVAQDLHFIR